MFTRRITMAGALDYQAELLVEANRERQILLAERAVATEPTSAPDDFARRLVARACRSFPILSIRMTLFRGATSASRNAWAE